VNPEQNLLSDIRDSLRGTSVDRINVPVSQKWINALWLLSLYITLFSAIMGVLAKAWLARFVPATTRREAQDAYRRYKLDKQAKRWYLKEVITLVPLLVQIAAFLFLGGLIVQSITDDQILGDVLLAVCIAGCAVYLMMSIFPLVVRSSPFRTPLSDPLLWFRKIFTTLLLQKWPKLNRESYFKTDHSEGLAEILYENVIKSPKPGHIDEAAAEIALPTFKKDWITYLCQNDTPHYLLTRFEKCASTRTKNATDRDEILCNHLLAFLQFVDHLGNNLAVSNPAETPAETPAEIPAEEIAAALPAETFQAVKLVIANDYKPLLCAMRTSLKPGFPLHRWNSLPEPLRPLLFGLRTQILCTLGPLSKLYQEHEHEDSSLPKFDFHSDELSDHPWELAFQDITSGHRLHFMLAACRGMLQGEKNLKNISTFILGLSLAKGGSPFVLSLD
jgi:hypothetical protein